MNVNPKKVLTLKNRTCYFNPDTSRIRIRVSSPYSYQYRELKIESYEARLYWQFKYCEDHLGQTFFYTLTYNDNAIPRPYGFNCFDYDDLRYLLTGGFRKQLLRKYGTTFKYFVGAELGDGKGSRGMHNNPHYHILFFLLDACDVRFPYKVISPEDFRHLVKLYWQGFDENIDGFRDYREAKFGIVKEGENCGKVTDFRAIAYVAKYVCKDIALKKSESDVESFVRLNTLNNYKFCEQSYKDYFKTRIFELFNIPLNPQKTEWFFTEPELVKRILSKETLDSLGSLNLLVFPYWSYTQSIINQYDLFEDYSKFVDDYVDKKVYDAIVEYRNRYCNKARISHGVGDYALNTINKDFPTIDVPTKDGFKSRPIGLYYFRKLFTDVVKDKRTGNNIYILNEDGMRFKANKLMSDISKYINKTQANYYAVVGNSDLFHSMRQSDVNVDVRMDYYDFIASMNCLTKNVSLYEIFKRYSEYKLVYEDRFFKIKSDGDSGRFSFPDIDVAGDYLRFLVPSFLSVSRNDLRLECFLENPPKDYLPYHSHPYFLRYLGVFRVFDLFSDYFFVQGDNKEQSEAERIASIKRFHNACALFTFYSNFKNVFR